MYIPGATRMTNLVVGCPGETPGLLPAAEAASPAAVADPRGHSAHTPKATITASEIHRNKMVQSTPSHTRKKGTQSGPGFADRTEFLWR